MLLFCVTIVVCAIEAYELKNTAVMILLLGTKKLGGF
jgi:hypothetical protein